MRAKVLSESDLSRVLARCDIQAAAMILLTHRAGLRAMEVAALDWRMVLDASGAIADHIDLPALATKGATGQGRIPVSSDLRRALLKLAAMRRFPTQGPVILAPRGGALSAHAIAQRIKRIYAKAGLDASSHSGRRSYATRLAGAGLNAFQVQRAMRHSDIGTTRLYVDDAASDRAVVAAISALAQ